MPAGYGDTDTKGRGGTARGRGRPGDPGSGDSIVHLMDWIDPRRDKTGKMIYTEGREYWEDGQIDRAENTRRMSLLEKYKKEDVARSKIKPIKDPEGDKSTARRTAAKQKRKGRQGTILAGRTTLSQGSETLG